MFHWLKGNHFCYLDVCGKSRQKTLEKLTVVQLRAELEFRGMEVNGKLKPELEIDLANLCKGISNFPALLQPCPDTTLERLNLRDYEVLGVEPLYDFKGHMSNLLEACCWKSIWRIGCNQEVCIGEMYIEVCWLQKGNNSCKPGFP